MSKRQLIEFINELDNNALREQIIDLYSRFKQVKEFYDFSFNPDENKRFKEAKNAISREYFPAEGKKAKKRRSVAQKHIIHFKKLEANPAGIADLMLFNLEIALTYYAENQIRQKAFYNSMLKSFREVLYYVQQQFLEREFVHRIQMILKQVKEQEFENQAAFFYVFKEIYQVH